jgi:hypothetical protein
MARGDDEGRRITQMSGFLENRQTVVSEHPPA